MSRCTLVDKLNFQKKSVMTASTTVFIIDLSAVLPFFLISKRRSLSSLLKFVGKI